MVVNLIDIDNLVLSDDFETWFERTNEIIDALNPLQIYDLDDSGTQTFPLLPAGFSLGLSFTRDLRFNGDLLININAEPPLGFNPATGALRIIFFGPGAPPLIAACDVANDDIFLIYDASAGVTKTVEASNMLPPTILCDHTFGDGSPDVTITILGDLIVTGTQTILNTTTVEATDPTIDLNSDGTGTGTPATNDAGLPFGGIRLLSTDGNKLFVWSNADNRWHISAPNAATRGFQIDNTPFPQSLFVKTIEPLTNALDLLGSGTGNAVSLHFHEVVSLTNPGDAHWRFSLREFNTTGQVAYTLGSYPVGGDPLNQDGTLVVEHSTASDAAPALDLQIYFDSVTPTYDGLIFGFARNLNADLLDGAHATQVPTPFAIPIALATGMIDNGWIDAADAIRKTVNQVGHGLVFGDIVRLDNTSPTALYIKAQANTPQNAEAVGIISEVIDLNNFVITLHGYMSGFVGLIPGEVYFLDTLTPGAYTSVTPGTGSIRKAMFVADSTTTAIVVNYVGGLTTTTTTGTFTAELTNDALGLGGFISGVLTIPVTVVERTFQTTTGVPLLLAVEDATGVGYRTFEITLTASTTLTLVQPVGANTYTNSVTLIIHQDGTGGRVPTIAISGGGTIYWDSSASQPPASLVANKTTVYVLINVTGTVGNVWYGSRAVFQV